MRQWKSKRILASVELCLQVSELIYLRLRIFEELLPPLRVFVPSKVSQIDSSSEAHLYELPEYFFELKITIREWSMHSKLVVKQGWFWTRRWIRLFRPVNVCHLSTFTWYELIRTKVHCARQRFKNARPFILAGTGHVVNQNACRLTFCFSGGWCPPTTMY